MNEEVEDLKYLYDLLYEKYEQLKGLTRQMVTGVKIILDQEEHLGTIDYMGKNVYKDLKSDVQNIEEVLKET